MPERILFVNESSDFVETTEYDVQEVIEFPGVGTAVVVNTNDTPAKIEQKNTSVVEANFNFEVSIDLAPDALDDDRIGEMEDVSALHDFKPEAAGDGKGYTVAAMDSGVDKTHPVFEGVNVKKVDFTDSNKVDTVGHGTAVLGCVTRIAPEADLIMLRVFGDKGRTSFRTLLRAYKWLFNHAEQVDVLNMSLGSRKTSPKFNEIHNKLAEKGILNVVSAGNSGGRSGSPATANTSYSVGACDDSGNMAKFSSYNPNGSNPEITALGKNVRLPKSRNANMGQTLSELWIKASGTSFSSPFVAGMVAALLSEDVKNPRKKLAQTASDLTGTPKDGQGLVKYEKANGKKKEDGDDGKKGDDGDKGDGDKGDGDKDDGSKKKKTADAGVWQFAGGDKIQIHADWLDDGNYEVTMTKDENGVATLKLKPE